jgi:signal transduction histidine kinase/CheY-like chemotaxis protein
VNTFVACSQGGEPTAFQQALADVLQRTADHEDDTHIWQEAISQLEQSLAPAARLGMAELLGNARLAISAQMQRQYRMYVLDERWISSRLSLLTAWLLTSLDEQQIYTVLANHLPEMDIQTAYLATFDAQGGDPYSWIVVRDTLDPTRELVRFRSYEFPSICISQDHPFILTLIPIMDQSGQLGFMAFDAVHFNLYGFIVQQLGGALNTVRLYRQATEARRLAEEANRMKSRFLSTISHELRTPLNLIVGLSGVMLQESEEGSTTLPDAIRKDIERVQAYTQHLGGLIGDVLDLASNDAGQLRLHNDYVDLGQTLQIVAESGRQLALDKGLTWHAEFPESGPWVWGDRTRLRQVVINLVNNAVKFTTRGEVRLTLTTDQGRVTVSVQDTGLGIPADEQSRIFDAFQRTEASISGGYPGLGLGLSICKTLVEMHSGVLSLHSSGIPGEGSTFYFTLPEVSPLEPPQALASKPPYAEKTLLFLFQDPAINDRLAAKLNEQGVKLQCIPMEHSADWQSSLVTTPPDTIVLDISEKSHLAWRAMKTIKNIPSIQGIPIIFMASRPQGESVLNLDYLTKPIEPEELTKLLDQHWMLTDSTQSVRTFLVVDDDIATLELHARIVRLQSPSNRVLTAANGRAALKLLSEEKIDLVLLDLQMPELDGFGVLQAMREMPRTHDIPVIVVTGKELTETDLEQLGEGVAVVLSKGLFTQDETIAHMGAALERKRRLNLDAQRLVRLAMLYIHTHYAEPISRGEIARHISIAEDYLTFCFRQELGTTPIKYLQRYRVNRAKHLLKNTSKSITEIALEVGFTDSGYFSRVFHRETNMPPEVFRRL